MVSLRFRENLRVLCDQDPFNLILPRSDEGTRKEFSVSFCSLLQGNLSASALQLLELGCVRDILSIHKTQLVSYMKLLKAPLGLIINFHELKLTDRVVRLILSGGNR
jgi:hypothetical protein